MRKQGAGLAANDRDLGVLDRGPMAGIRLAPGARSVDYENTRAQ